MNTILVCVERFEGDRVILEGKNGEIRLSAPRSLLPAGISEGDWVVARVNDDLVVSLRIDEQSKKAQREAEERINEKLESLRKRKKV